MRNIFYLLTALFIHGCGCTGVYAQSFSVNTQEVFTGIDSKLNYVKNPFGKDNALYISTSSATAVRDSSTDKLFGYASISCDASAINGYCEFQLKPIVDPHKNGLCQFKGVFKGDGTLYRAQILDASSNVIVQTPVLGTSSSNWTPFSATGPCQASPKVRITQTESGTAPVINVGVYYGPDSSVGVYTPPTVYTALIADTGAVSRQYPSSWVSCVTSGATGGSGYDCTLNGAMAGLTATPNCAFTLASGNGLVNESRIYNVTTSLVQIFSNTQSTFARLAGVLTCTKSPSDTAVTVVKNENADFGWRTYSGTISSSTGTLPARTLNYLEYSRFNGQMYLRGGFTFTATGTWGGIVIPFPSGITTSNTTDGVSASDKVDLRGSFFHTGTVTKQTSSLTIFGLGPNSQLTIISQTSPFTWAIGNQVYWISGPISVSENGVPWQPSQGAWQIPSNINSADSDSNYMTFSAYTQSCSGSSCTIASREGNAISAIGRTGAGAYSMTFTGLNNAPIWCDCQSVGANDQTCHVYNITNTGAAQMRSYQIGTASAQESLQLRVWCKVKK